MNLNASARCATVLVLVAMLVLAGCDRLREPHERGTRYVASGKYAEAVQAFTEAAEDAAAKGDKVAEAIAYANRCYANDLLGRQEDAISDCDRSLELVPDDPEVLNNRGVAYLNKGAVDEAETDLDRAIELRPEYAAAFANRGRMWLERERFERALEDLDRAIELDPNLAQAYANRASALGNLGRKDEALEAFDRSLELMPDALVYFTRGMYHLRFAEFDEAYADYKKAAELEPDTYVGYMASTEAKFLENRPTEDPADHPTAAGGTAGTQAPATGTPRPTQRAASTTPVTAPEATGSPSSVRP